MSKFNSKSYTDYDDDLRPRSVLAFIEDKLSTSEDNGKHEGCFEYLKKQNIYSNAEVVKSTIQVMDYYSSITNRYDRRWK